MKRSLIVPVLFLLLARVEAQEPTFTSSANLVIIDVNVRDKAGNVIPNLGKNDFTLFEDGKAQTISVFEFQKLEGDTASGKPGSPIEEAAGLSLQTLSGYFQSHPPAAARMAQVRALINDNHWPTPPVRPLALPTEK